MNDCSYERATICRRKETFVLQTVLVKIKPRCTCLNLRPTSCAPVNKWIKSSGWRSRTAESGLLSWATRSGGLGKLYKHCQVTQLPHLLFLLTPQLVWNCNNLPTEYSHSSPAAQTTILLPWATSPEERAGRGQIKVWPLKLSLLISSGQQDKLR